MTTFEKRYRNHKAYCTDVAKKGSSPYMVIQYDGTEELKTIWLDPDGLNLRVLSDDGRPYTKRFIAWPDGTTREFEDNPDKSGWKGWTTVEA